MSDVRAVMHVATLPETGKDGRAPIWWGTTGIVVIEGFVFAVLIAAYFYLRKNVADFPPGRTPAPDLLLPTVNVAIFLTSLWPARMIHRCANSHDRAGIIGWSWVLTAFALATIGLRVFEFEALNTRWDSDAYGSTIWALVFTHALHLVTTTGETIVLAVLHTTGPVEKKHYEDRAADALYWYYVVASWVLIYAVVFLGPFWV